MCKSKVSRGLITRKKKWFSVSLIMYLYEMMDIHLTFSGNHFRKYIYQIIIQYTISLYRAVYQILDFPGGKEPACQAGGAGSGRSPGGGHGNPL